MLCCFILSHVVDFLYIGLNCSRMFRFVLFCLKLQCVAMCCSMVFKCDLFMDCLFALVCFVDAVLLCFMSLSAVTGFVYVVLRVLCFPISLCCLLR